MKCPKCGYISFDFNDTCPKCNRDLSEVKRRLNIFPFKPIPVNWLEEKPSSTLETEEVLEKPVAASTEIEKEQIELETINLESLEIEPDKKEKEEKEIELETLDLKSLEIELEKKEKKRG